MLDTKYTLKTITNANVLVHSFYQAKKGVSWKGSVQKYELNLLANTYRLKTELEQKTYQAKPFVEFPLYERGNARWIKSMHIRDRVVQRTVCDNILLPLIKPYLIYDNGASLQNKGIDFALDRVQLFLKQYYNTYHTNQGYVILVDFTKYFDNIPHKELYDLFVQDIEDQDLKELLKYLISLFQIDLSGLPLEKQIEYRNLFNGLEYSSYIHQHMQDFDNSLELLKSVGIGSQISQLAGIYYPTKIDNYFKIVQQCKWYERYMDDTLIIVHTLTEAEKLLNDYYILADQLHIHVNKKKTQIIQLSNGFNFLKVRFILTSTGKVIRKLNKQTFIRARRKMRKLHKKLQKHEITMPDIEQSYQSSLGRMKQFHNYTATHNFIKLYNDLFNQT